MVPETLVLKKEEISKQSDNSKQDNKVAISEKSKKLNADAISETKSQKVKAEKILAVNQG